MGMIRGRGFREGFTLISLLLTLVVLFILYYLVLKPYFRSTVKTLSGSGMDTSSPAKIIDNVKNTLQKAGEQVSDY